MKKILIALDYDPSAEAVAETGYALAKAMQAETILVHVLADSLYYLPLDYSPIMGFAGISKAGLIENMDVEELKNGARFFLESSKQHLGDPDVKTIIAEGDSAQGILSTAARENVSVIVVGSHSRSAIGKLLMGSVTEKLLQHTTLPLFIVPTKKK